MKKLSLVVFLFIIFSIIFSFYNNHLKGAWPAILPVRQPETAVPTGAVKPSQNTTGLPLKIPNGFTLSVFSENLGSPRDLIEDPNGIILVSLIKEGKVVALPDGKTILQNLNKPHGLAFKGDKLYVAETHQVTSYDYNKNTLRATNPKKIIDLPDGGNHFSRSIIFKGDLLLISVGSSCNVCKEKDQRRAAIIGVKEDGTSFTYATGLRNSVFMAIHPETEDLWATEMGRDLLGDDIPPDEINIVKEGRYYGWPYCYGKNSKDSAFDDSDNANKTCAASEPSIINLKAHSAPLGLAFYNNDLLVAYHGSWNRTVPTGYKIVRIKKLDSSPVVEDFITGWLEGNEAYGRPVDILVSKLGTIFISDDKKGVVYSLKP